MTIPSMVPRLLLAVAIGAAALWLALNRHDAAIFYGAIALALLAAIAFLPRLIGRLREETPAWIEAGELAARLNGAGGIAVIDVRGPDEFTGPLGHIGDALNVPVGELGHRLQDLAPLAARQVVLVCHTDRRSARAAGLLREAGFGDVRVLRGGMVRWTEAGLPVAGR